MNKRYSGILMPVSSFPTKGSIGSMGKEAYAFIDFLKRNHQTYWQLLPLGPTSYGDSPYQSFSIFAGNPYFIDLETLKNKGLLQDEELPQNIDTFVDYEKLYFERFPLLHKAYEKLTDKEVLYNFMEENDWVFDYALFMALKKNHEDKPWHMWENYKFYHSFDRDQYFRDHEEQVLFWVFLQQEFYEEWMKLKSYANEQGIKVIGDIPLYVSYDSVEVWKDPHLFVLDENLTPISVAGYPPDAFSELGQLWGNPLYDWNKHRETHYSWWQMRLLHQQKLYDFIRLDHFIGFCNYWAIPYGDTDAIGGHWEEGPGEHFFQVINMNCPELQLIAEDLGNVTKEVTALRIFAGLPSMRVLQFGFDPNGDSDALPHHYDLEIIAYTGTHDNETIMGWWNNRNEEEQAFARHYMDMTTESIVEAMIKTLWRSSAKTVITTMQDLLYLDNTYRMNTPNTLGNWTFRAEPNYLEKIDQNFLKETTLTYRRNPDESL